MSYGKIYNVRKTSQREAIPGRKMTKNAAGGYAFAIDIWSTLNRFLILGTEGGTYYVKERKLTLDNVEAVLKCLAEDGVRTVKEAVKVSQAGRAPKNEPAIFMLALAVKFGDNQTQDVALAEMPNVCRFGTHLFTFAQYLKDLDVTWSRKVRKAFERWYNMKPAQFAAYQVLKYQGRNVYEKDKSSRWTHADILRLAHPKPETSAHSAVFRYAIRGWEGVEIPELDQIAAFEAAKGASDEKSIVSLIHRYNLTREMVPTNWLNSTDVWAALFEKMPMTAMVRNLGKMTQVGLIAQFSDVAKEVASRLADREYIKKSRLHPMSVLKALRQYQTGKSRNIVWSPNRQVVDALDNAFYLAFDNVEPTGKNIMLALDVSGSMAWDSSQIPGMNMTARVASSAMAMVTARAEPNYMTVAFTSGRGWGRYAVTELDISPRERLDDVMRRVDGLYAGGTDCALPFLYAIKNKIPVDAVIIYTDNDSWAGDIHVTQAVKLYRQKMGRDVKLVACAMAANTYSVADPQDPNQIDVVGFDTSTPAAISEFIRG